MIPFLIFYHIYFFIWTIATLEVVNQWPWSPQLPQVGLARRLESLILLPNLGRAGLRKSTTSFSKLFNCEFIFITIMLFHFTKYSLCFILDWVSFVYVDCFQLLDRKGAQLNKFVGHLAGSVLFSPRYEASLLLNVREKYQTRSAIELLTLCFCYSDLTEIGRKLKILLVQNQLFRLGKSSSAMCSNFYLLLCHYVVSLTVSPWVFFRLEVMPRSTSWKFKRAGQ